MKDRPRLSRSPASQLHRSRYSGPFALLLALTSTLAGAQGSAPTGCSLPNGNVGDSVALVLSGGGAHGLAHIGLLEVLDSLGVRPRLIVGTSMGALVGALYAGGYSGRQIDSIARHLPLDEIFRRYPALTFITSGDLASPLLTAAPAFVVEQVGTTIRLQSPAAREPQLNALFDQLLLHPNILAAGDFSRLPIPFLAVATDMRSRAPITLGDGDLAQAVRASIAIPIVVSPVARNERMLMDGGLSANVPVDIARRHGMTRLVVSDVGSTSESPVDLKAVQSTTGMLGYLLDGLFSQGPYVLGPQDVAIRPNVDASGLLNFSRDAIGPLIAAGYQAAVTTLRGCEVQPARLAGTPDGATPDERRIAERLMRLSTEGVYESVWLNPRRDTTARATVGAAASTSFAPVASVAPGRIAGVGLAYDNHDGVRAWVATSSSSIADGRLSASGAASLGEWRQQLLVVLAGLRRHPLRAPNAARPGSVTELLPDPRSDQPPWSMLTRDLLRPSLSLTGTRETVRLYDSSAHEVGRTTTRDLTALLGASAAFGSAWLTAVGPFAHLWHEDGAPRSSPETAVGGLLRIARLLPAPSTGPDKSAVPAITSELLWTDHYRRALLAGDIMAEVDGFQLRPRMSLGTGEHLPLAAAFRLGGLTGFPGLIPGERRGDRVQELRMAVSHALMGPWYWRVDVGRGYTRTNTELPTAVGGWVTGMDAGLATDTPLGPLELAFGVATHGHRVLKVRIGG